MYMRYTIVRLRYKIYITYIIYYIIYIIYIYTKGYYVKREQIGKDRKGRRTCANRKREMAFAVVIFFSSAMTMLSLLLSGY